MGWQHQKSPTPARFFVGRLQDWVRDHHNQPWPRAPPPTPCSYHHPTVYGSSPTCFWLQKDLTSPVLHLFATSYPSEHLNSVDSCSASILDFFRRDMHTHNMIFDIQTCVLKFGFYQTWIMCEQLRQRRCESCRFPEMRLYWFRNRSRFGPHYYFRCILENILILLCIIWPSYQDKAVKEVKFGKGVCVPWEDCSSRKACMG